LQDKDKENKANEILEKYIYSLLDKLNDTPPQSPAKKHHYVPRFYLESFSHPKTNMITVVDKLSGSYFEQTSDATGFEKDFYIVGERQKEDWHVLAEIFWSLIESDVAPIYRKILQHKQISLTERVVFSIFVCSMICRSRSAIRLMREMAGGLVDKVMKFVAEDEKRFKKMTGVLPGYSENLSGSMRDDILNDKVKAMGNQNLSSPAAPSNTITLSPYILHMTWNVFKPSRQVVTSDTPALTFSPQSLVLEGGKIGGVALKESRVLFPLAPDSIFLAEWNKQDYQIAYSRLPERHTKNYNNIIVSAADRFVYLAFPHHDILRFIENRRNRRIVHKMNCFKSIDGEITCSEQFISNFKA